MKNKSLIVILLVGFVFLATAWAESDQTLEEIRKAIAEKGAKWEPRETWISRLSPEERKGFLGSIRPASPPVEIMKPLSGVTLPDSFDWRNNDGHDWTTTVKNQTSCGNCWSYASCGILEAKVKLILNEPDLHWASINLSEMFLTSCSGRGCELGWGQTSTLNYIRTHGVPDHACFPGSYPPVPSCSDTCENKYLRSLHFEDWDRNHFFRVDSNAINTIKDRIINYGPVSVHFDVYTDFYNYGTGIYEHVTGGYEGGHAVILVGWGVAGTDSFWIVKNSWGSDWGGLDGWFRIRMARSGVGIDHDIWYITELDSASIPRITLTTPSGGENWMVGTNHTVKWISPYFSGYVKLEYSTNGGSTWSSVDDSTFDDGSNTWANIPNTPSTNCKMRISDAADGIPWVLGDSTFSITTLGDINCDGNITIADVVYVVNYVFKDGNDPCIQEAGNVNCDWTIDITDALFLVNYLFRDGPGPDC